MNDQPAVAFFDVDDTVTTAPTIFRFLRHYLAARGSEPEEYPAVRVRLRMMTAHGGGRERANAAYYHCFAGVNAHEVARLGQRWFAAEIERGGLLNTAVVDELLELQARGTRVVFVSGSFSACLAPLARHLNVDRVICSQPTVRDGRYTGDLDSRPMIGQAKADAVVVAAAQLGVSAADCVAYGDHPSDLPMLEAVGRAVVVGADSALRAHAIHGSWRHLPAGLAPPDLPLPARGR